MILLPLPCCSTPRHVTSPAALLPAAAVHVCPTKAVAK